MPATPDKISGGMDLSPTSNADVVGTFLQVLIKLKPPHSFNKALLEYVLRKDITSCFSHYEMPFFPPHSADKKCNSYSYMN